MTDKIITEQTQGQAHVITRYKSTSRHYSDAGKNLQIGQLIKDTDRAVWRLMTGACADEFGDLNDYSLVGFPSDQLELDLDYIVSTDAWIKVAENSYDVLPDFPYFSAGTIACKKHLDGRLLGMLQRYSRCYDVVGGTIPCAIYIPNVKYDAFCRRFSEFSLFGLQDDPNKIMHVKEFVLKSRKLTGQAQS